MSGAAAIVRSPLAVTYDFGTEHPMRAARAELAIELAVALGVLDRPCWKQVHAEPAIMPDLALVQDPTYLGLVRAADRDRKSVV